MGFQISLPIDKYSEQVIRKSLYWLSEKCKWQLIEKSDSWNITIFGEDSLEEYANEFNRLLNDFKLREKLDSETKNLRLKVVSAALKKMSEDG